MTSTETAHSDTATLGYTRAKIVSLKSHHQFNEKWLQERIAEDPSILGLADNLQVLAVERRQQRAGRLDLLLVDPETLRRYELEIQLGATDESHIIRTIEYWDNERRRYPDREHIAVIAAEDITSRFLNVISLFNKAIPLIAVQVRALQVGNVVTLSCTKVLDLSSIASEAEEVEPGASADRAYWENIGSKEMLTIADELLSLINDLTSDDSLSLKYNKSYIGLARHGMPDNFIVMRPAKTNMVTEFRVPRADELSARLEAEGFDVMTYVTRYGNYRLRLGADDFIARRDTLVDLIRRASGTPAPAEGREEEVIAGGNEAGEP